MAKAIGKCIPKRYKSTTLWERRRIIRLNHGRDGKMLGDLRYLRQCETAPRASWMEDDLRNTWVVVCRDADRVYGWVLLQSHTDEDSELQVYVAKKFRGKGIGSRLIQAGSRLAKRLGWCPMVYYAEQPDFFEKNGFTHDDEVRQTTSATHLAAGHCPEAIPR